MKSYTPFTTNPHPIVSEQIWSEPDSEIVEEGNLHAKHLSEDWSKLNNPNLGRSRVTQARSIGGASPSKASVATTRKRTNS